MHPPPFWLPFSALREMYDRPMKHRTVCLNGHGRMLRFKAFVEKNKIVLDIMLDFNHPRIKQKVLEYFMFTDKRKIPLDQYMVRYNEECLQVGQTIQRMVADKRISLRLSEGGIICQLF